MALDAASYLQQLQAVLLRGKAWTREPGSVMTQLLTGVAQEFARGDLRAEQAMNEADPRTTLELLADWEEFAGLPDPCVTTEQTLVQRREALVSKLLMQGGQSRAYFIAIAESLGYIGAEIEEYNTFDCGDSGCGDALWSEADRFAWQLSLPGTGSIEYFNCGESGCGDALQSWGDELLECRVNRFKPAHTTAIFAYI